MLDTDDIVTNLNVLMVFGNQLGSEVYARVMFIAFV